MIVAVTSTVLFEVPDTPLRDLHQHFYTSNVVALNVPMATLSGLTYVMRALPDLRVEPADDWRRRREAH